MDKRTKGPAYKLYRNEASLGKWASGRAVLPAKAFLELAARWHNESLSLVYSAEALDGS